jgi:hypothetical protein
MLLAIESKNNTNAIRLNYYKIYLTVALSIFSMMRNLLSVFVDIFVNIIDIFINFLVNRN